jgi:hypothetical protein
LASSDGSEDCSDLLPGFFYTGAGAISDDTVVACPERFFCDGSATITVATNNMPVGREACPVGSGSAASSDSRDDCLVVDKGYYFDGDGTCSGVAASGAPTCTYKECHWQCLLPRWQCASSHLHSRRWQDALQLWHAHSVRRHHCWHRLHHER